jgi:argininosuccinate lyase
MSARGRLISSPRLAMSQDDAFRRINDSLAFDWRLAPYDVAQSVAHARMLAACGIISAGDRDALVRALEQVAQEVTDGSFRFADGDEDVHMAIERRVTELAGEAGGRLHTARSRNDQVATDLALYTRDAALGAEAAALGLAQTLIDLAGAHADWPMPGYTHLQRAQPVYLGHHLLAYAWMLLRDARRFRAVLGATAALPLGVGALAGVNFATDRELLAAELGFTEVSENSIDAVSNRDFVLDHLAACATCATHLSRLGAELVLWSSEEFGFCELSDAWASGSSIMPQKKNPDAAELLRAKAPRISARLGAMHGVLHGLALTYNKDMQEDKEHLFDAVDTLALMLAAAQGMLETISFRRERLAAAAGDELLAATDIADYLVGKGLPFRSAHHVVGGLVRLASASGRTLSQLAEAELREASPLIDPGEFRALLASGAWLESKVSRGGTGSQALREQLGHAQAAIERARAGA